MILSNYWLASVLPVFFKLIEGITYYTVNNYINKNTLSYKYNFGFQRGIVILKALIVLSDKISDDLKRAEFVIVGIPRFSKAFDTVDQSVLLSNIC